MNTKVIKLNEARIKFNCFWIIHFSEKEKIKSNCHIKRTDHLEKIHRKRIIILNDCLCITIDSKHTISHPILISILLEKIFEEIQSSDRRGSHFGKN